MNVHEIAQILAETATLLELKGANPFKIRAYRSAARAIETVSDRFEQIVKDGKLAELPGIGAALADHIAMLHDTGTLPLHEELKQSIPAGLIEMLSIPGLGAKKIKAIQETLDIETIRDLKAACEKRKLRDVPGFGEKSEHNVLQGIQHLEQYTARHLWWDGMLAASPILNALEKHPLVDKASLAGSLLRKKETIGDIDLLAASAKSKSVMDWFTGADFVSSITAKGDTRASIRTPTGIQVDLRIVPLEQFPFALNYFTGSKEHNIKLRQLAKSKGFILNEYSLDPINTKTENPFAKHPPKNESAIYAALGLPFIEPELREGCGELEAAMQQRLPRLVELDDIRGAFHIHTSASDGHNTLEEMAEAAEKRGWEYLGISDHSKSSVQAHGLDEERLFKQIESIEKLNRSKKFHIHIFSGVECDILSDGILDFDDAVLQRIDYVVVSIHRGFTQDANTMTKRLIKAIENPYSTMVGHLTGRLLLQREPYALDADKVIDAAIANNTIIEINAQPQRLDMDWRLWHRAKEKGLMTSINPDAHATQDLDYIAAGINVARKGWLEKGDILNTYPLKQVKKILNRKTC